jgi:hypothetical protein
MRIRLVAAAGAVIFAGTGLAGQSIRTLADINAQEELQAQWAIDAAARSNVEPIPLKSGDQVMGALYDHFLLGVVVARAAAHEGRPMDVKALTSWERWRFHEMVAVVYPVDCNGKPAQPVSLRIETVVPVPGQLRPAGSPVRGDHSQAVLPGVDLPPDALVTPLPGLPLPGARVVVDYAAPVCRGAAPSMTFPVQVTPSDAGRPINAIRLPESLASLPSPSTARVFTLIDLDGHAHPMFMQQGPEELAAFAKAAIAAKTYAPERTNGVPTVGSVLVAVVFTASGEPGVVAPFTPAPPPPGSNMTSVTSRVLVPVGGAPPATGTSAPPPMPPSRANGPGGVTMSGATHATTTPDVPGLSAATSKCAIADDQAYGTTLATAIRVGGGNIGGPAREQKYLNALRGPNGEGLHYTRLGSLPTPDESIILDLYEISSPGLAQPVRLYIDEYHLEELKAPKGLVCATPFDIK